MRPLTTTTQRKLPLRGESLPLVLATVAQARALLTGYDEDDIKALWEDKLLAFVWDIGLGYTLEPRIFPDALRHYAATLGSRPYERTFDQIVEEMLHTNKPHLTSTQLRLLLNCGATHVTNLIEEKQLTLVPGTDYQRGRNGAALITLDSLRAYFTKQRLS